MLVCECVRVCTQVYYVNIYTGLSVWERPTEPAFKPEDDLPLGWEEHADDDGTPYYVNLVTGESVWIKPTQPA